MRKVSNIKGWIILIFTTSTFNSLDSLYPIILTGVEARERLRKNFQKRQLYVEMGGIGFCCDIINDPQKFAKGKGMWKWGGIDFCCGQYLMMVWVTLAYLCVEFFPSRQGMLTNQNKILILFKSTDCLDW